MKKILALFIITLTLLTAAGCGESSAEVNLVPSDILSPVAIYSMAVHVEENPTDYIGKTVQAEGYINYSIDSSTGYYIRVDDSTGCCNVDLEFRLPGGMESPEDFSRIRISGIFHSYTHADGTEVLRIDAESIMDEEALKATLDE